jgi:Flp pilus assembly protein TadD
MKNGTRALPAAIATELVALYGAGKWAQLVVAADRATTRYPRHLLGWQASGKALLQLGKTPEAIDMLSRVVQLAPGEADGYNDLGNALHQLGRTDEAITSYHRAVELNPRSSEAYSNLGRILCERGRFEESVASCQRAIDIASWFTHRLQQSRQCFARNWPGDRGGSAVPPIACAQSALLGSPH